MDNDLEVGFKLSGESKNCYIYEPEEGGDVVSKLYVRKTAWPGSETITIIIRECEPEDLKG